MKLRIFGRIGLSVVSLPLVGCRHSSAQPSAEVTDAEYQVLSAYMAHKIVDDIGNDRAVHTPSQIVLVNKAQGPLTASGIAELNKEIPMLNSQMLGSFRLVCDHPANFHRLFDLPVSYDIIGDAQIAFLERGDFWANFYRKYQGSGGIWRLSRVGFSPDGKQAVFIANNSCGGRCGKATFVIMKKIDSSWTTMEEVLLQVS
jgi:hypothetical protein